MEAVFRSRRPLLLPRALTRGQGCQSLVWGVEAWAQGRLPDLCAGCSLLWTAAEPLALALAAQNSLLAAGIVSLYLPPHSLLCTSAKNLPVISKLRQMYRQYYQQSTSAFLSTEAAGRELEGLCCGLPLERHWELNMSHRCSEGVGYKRSGQKSHWISPLKTCLRFLVWRLKSHILALLLSGHVLHHRCLDASGNGLG